MIKRTTALCVAIILTTTLMLQGCSAKDNKTPQNSTGEQESNQTTQDDTPADENVTAVRLTSKDTKLADGLSAVQYQGEDGFEGFLAQGGAASDAEAVEFLVQNILSGAEGLSIAPTGFACSTISVKGHNGDALFGRNFDWQECEALVLHLIPNNAYASISTVNMNFIRQGGGTAVSLALMNQDIRTRAAIYAPLDGMNEMGFTIAVNMIEDAATIDQNTDKPDLTTTTAVRLLLNKAKDVPEAIVLLKEYDMHSSMGLMVHFAMSDAAGNSVVVEYINNEMIVTNTQVVTNFYLADGEKNGLGSSESHARYDTLMARLSETQEMKTEDVRDALDSVSKDNFGEFDSTEWSVVYNKTNKKVRYYHRENYGDSYTFELQ